MIKAELGSSNFLPADQSECLHVTTEDIFKNLLCSHEQNQVMKKLREDVINTASRQRAPWSLLNTQGKLLWGGNHISAPPHTNLFAWQHNFHSPSRFSRHHHFVLIVESWHNSSSIKVKLPELLSQRSPTDRQLDKLLLLSAAHGCSQWAGPLQVYFETLPQNKTTCLDMWFEQSSV